LRETETIILSNDLLLVSTLVTSFFVGSFGIMAVRSLSSLSWVAKKVNSVIKPMNRKYKKAFR
jgi:hypothetical protein